MHERYCDEHFCLSVCPSVSLSARISRKPLGRTSPNFLCMFRVAVARSFSDGVAIRYVLLVLRIATQYNTII